METIKTSKNVEFDVIYADGTRRHVSEGVLFEVENDHFIFHCGTSRAAVLVYVAEAAAEAVGTLDLNEEEKTTIAMYICKRIFDTRNKAEDMEETTT